MENYYFINSGMFGVLAFNILLIIAKTQKPLEDKLLSIIDR